MFRAMFAFGRKRELLHQLVFPVEMAFAMVQHVFEQLGKFIIFALFQAAQQLQELGMVLVDWVVT